MVFNAASQEHKSHAEIVPVPASPDHKTSLSAARLVKAVPTQDLVAKSARMICCVPAIASVGFAGVSFTDETNKLARAEPMQLHNAEIESNGRT